MIDSRSGSDGRRRSHSTSSVRRPASALARASEQQRATGQAGVAAPLPLAVVLAGSPSARPGALLSSPQFAEFLAQVRAAYEVIVIDTCPLLAVADTLAVLPHVDATLLCVRAGRTRHDEAQAARDVLARVPHGATGLVVTGIGRAGDAGYYHDDVPEREPALVA